MRQIGAERIHFSHELACGHAHSARTGFGACQSLCAPQEAYQTLLVGCFEGRADCPVEFLPHIPTGHFGFSSTKPVEQERDEVEMTTLKDPSMVQRYLLASLEPIGDKGSRPFLEFGRDALDSPDPVSGAFLARQEYWVHEIGVGFVQWLQGDKIEHPVVLLELVPETVSEEHIWATWNGQLPRLLETCLQHRTEAPAQAGG